MLKTLFLVATMAMAVSPAPVELPPGVDPACIHTYPICGVPLTLQQANLNHIHAQNIALEKLKAQQLALNAQAPYVPIVGPANTGVIRQGETIGASGEVLYHN